MKRRSEQPIIPSEDHTEVLVARLLFPRMMPTMHEQTYQNVLQKDWVDVLHVRMHVVVMVYVDHEADTSRLGRDSDSVRHPHVQNATSHQLERVKPCGGEHIHLPGGMMNRVNRP